MIFTSKRLYRKKIWQKNGGPGGFEPPTSRTQSENHTPRPLALLWAWRDLNPQPSGLESDALTIAPQALEWLPCFRIYSWVQSFLKLKKLENKKATPEGFEPSRAKPNGLAGRRLNHSAKVSYAEHTKILSFNIFLKLKLYLVCWKILFSSRLVGRVV